MRFISIKMGMSARVFIIVRRGGLSVKVGDIRDEESGYRGLRGLEGDSVVGDGDDGRKRRWAD
jgi:hypothetical protein